MVVRTPDSKAFSLFAIFLNNKIITCDTAVPLVMDVHNQNPKMVVEFYVGDWKTFQMIRANRVLWDAIHNIGRLIYYGRTEEDRARGIVGLLAHRLRLLALLGRLSFTGLVGKAVFMHFRALNHWPLRFLHFVNGSNTYLCEGVVTGYSENERQIDNAWAKRIDHHVNAAASGGLIGFSSEWRHFVAPKLANAPKYNLGKFWYGNAWPKYVDRTAGAYLDEDFLAAGIAPSSEILVYILGYLGSVESVSDANTFKELLHRTLTVLKDEAPDIPVFIKPHPNTDTEYLRDVISKFESNKFVISHLHPAVLSTRARMFIANYYSTTMAVARSFSVPVVEYSNYSPQARDVTGGGSMRPDIVDHYVDNDQEKFRITVRQLLDRPHVPTQARNHSDGTGIIARIAGNMA